MRRKFKVQNSKFKISIQKSKFFRTFEFLLAFLTFTFCLLTFVSPVFAQQATLSLTPSTGTFNRGCNFSLNIDLNTGGAQTDGTDAILIYDQSRFTVNSIQSGTIYPDYPGNSIDSPDPGKITVSGLASVSQAFTGSGTLATINFTVKSQAPTGATQIKFDFDPADKSKTTDSNVVQRGTVADILNSVVDGNYTVGTGTCAASGAGIGTGTGTGTGGGQGGTSTSSGQIIYKTLPGGGTPELTATMVIVGSILTVLGILGLALL